ncbi:hypothetical protein V492_07349 [Pseudogymnoascus sp. VKM F-4246]|nr:hypothetical protein V492_07349 [Pseudogymnoascus sp. VKM F-4246]
MVEPGTPSQQTILPFPTKSTSLPSANMKFSIILPALMATLAAATPILDPTTSLESCRMPGKDCDYPGPGGGCCGLSLKCTLVR